MDINDMNAELGARQNRGEFELRVVDGEEVEREVHFRTYGFLLVEYRYSDGRPSTWGVLFPNWPKEMLMSTDQAEILHDALGHVLHR